MRPVACLMLTAISLTGSDYSLLKGRVQFTVPADWREVRRVENDSLSFVAFVVPRPRADSGAPAGNVMIDAAVSGRNWSLKSYSDAKVAQVAAGPGSPALVDDTFWDENHSRTVLWTSRLRETPYVLWNKFAVRDSIYLSIYTAIPVAYANDSTWQVHYEDALQEMLDSFRVQRQRVVAKSK